MELYPLWVLLIAAGVTLFTRALPFAVFGGKRTMPGAVRYLGGVLPGAIIAILVIYCLKGLPAAGGMEAAFQLGALAVTAVLHLWRRNTLLSIFGGTAVYMLLIRLPL